MNILNKIKLNLCGDGNFYVIFILTTVLLGAFALTGGLRPDLDNIPDDYTEVSLGEVDPNTATGSAIQMIGLKGTIVPKATPTECVNNPVVVLLVDVSESMKERGKGENLKSALKLFSDGLPVSTQLAMYTFSNEFNLNFNLQQLSNTKIDFKKDVDSLTFEGSTEMREAFVSLQSVLAGIKSSNPNAPVSMILVSDGVPEQLACPDSPNNVIINPTTGRRYCAAQDPTLEPNIATEIKNQDISIYSIGIFDTVDEKISEILTRILQNVASSPTNYSRADGSGNGLSQIFSNLSTSVCQ